MGCDIHLYLETKKAKGSFIRRLVFPRKKWERIYPSPVYTGGRNYNLFTALCGVRADNFTDPICISTPKGIPKDVCAEIMDIIKDWDGDGHSHSYNTLKELKDFDWNHFGETTKEFLKEVIPKMQDICTKDTDVRIVYFFDN